MKKRKIVATLLAVSIVFSTAVQAGAESSEEIQEKIDQLEQEKEEIREEIDRVSLQINDNYDEISKILSEKAVIDQEIQLLSEEIAKINEQIDGYNILIAEKQEELEKAEENLRELNEKYKERICAMEKDGGISFWSVIFQAKSFSELLDNMRMMQEISSSDNERMNEMNIAADVVKEAQNALAVEKQNLLQKQSEIAQKQSEMKQKQEDSNALITKLTQEAKDLDALLLSFEQQESEFLAEIARQEVQYDEAKQREWEEYLESQKPPVPTPPENSEDDSGQEGSDENGSESNQEPDNDDNQESNKPNTDNDTWIKPCDYVLLTSPFGYRIPPTEGASTFHQGVDLAGPEGTPIYAARSGQVIYAGYGYSGGNYVHIDHFDGYRSLYLHMTHYVVESGEYVSQGQLIGYMGSTGVSTGPHLHFGISYNGVYVNPCEYINLTTWG